MGTITPRTEFIEKLLRCRSCLSLDVLVDGTSVQCASCGDTQCFDIDGILTDKRLEQPVNVKATYHSNTRHRYQSNDYARRYLSAYSTPTTMIDAYAAFVAMRERSRVRQLINKVCEEIETVLDFPAGTGKLANVIAEYSFGAVAADISTEMLRAGITEWKQCRGLIGIVQSDICKTNFRDASFDCVICLRLMHRVPDHIALQALEEIARMSRKYFVVSTRLDRFCVASLLGRRNKKFCRTCRTQKRWHEMLSSFGEVQAERLVSWTMSTEAISLVRISRR